MVALEDEETGRKGCIFIYYCMDLKESQKLQQSSVSKMVWMTRSVHLRIAGVHVCFQDPVIRPLGFILVCTPRVLFDLYINKPTVYLTFFHSPICIGTHLEVFYALLT